MVEINAIVRHDPISQRFILRESSEEEKMIRLDWLIDVINTVENEY